FIPPSLSTPASIVGSITSPSEASLLLLVPTFLSPTQFKCAKFILRYPTAKLLRDCSNVGCIVSRDDLIQHATKICRSILKQQIRAPLTTGISGGFDISGRTTPTATRIEGLCAALDFLSDPDLTSAIRTSITTGIIFLLKAEITVGKYAGGMPGSAILLSPGASIVRIDYVQHALSAWLSFAALQSQPPHRNFQLP
ncbi:MAG: hypothetical protein P4L69_24725, partial [Desulfosporosinus sp.]|nr:hypothetical protein [Desulfosporosinus sp.]